MSDSFRALELGQKITNVSAQNRRRVARIAAFVVPDDQGDRAEPEVFALSAAHAVGTTHYDKIQFREKIFGRIDYSRFIDKFSRARSDEKYACLTNICLIRVDKGIEVHSTLRGRKIDRVCSAKSHFFSGDRQVSVKQNFVGEITRVKAGARLIDRDGREIFTNGFFVKNSGGAPVSRTPGSSGRPIFTSDGQLLGMVVAESGNEIFCVDLSEVLDCLGAKLYQSHHEISDRRAYA